MLRDAATAAELLDAGDDRGAAELSAAALERYRGEVLPARPATGPPRTGHGSKRRA